MTLFKFKQLLFQSQYKFYHDEATARWVILKPNGDRDSFRIQEIETMSEAFFLEFYLNMRPIRVPSRKKHTPRKTTATPQRKNKKGRSK